MTTNVNLTIHRGGLQPNAHSYLQRISSPLTGLQQNLAVVLGDDLSARLNIVTGQLTGIHRMLGMEKSPSYHLGGCGIHLEEAMMRLLGETVERYAHMAYVIDRSRPSQRATLAEQLRRHGREHVLAVDDLKFFSDEQLASEGFPFQSWWPEAEFAWTEAVDVATGKQQWIPTQLAIVGYLRPPANGDGLVEPWLSPAITTGTAAHTKPTHALRSALLELVQGHVATGHWYSSMSAPQIVLDDRTPALRRITERDLPRHRSRMRFYYLGGEDLGVHVVAAVQESTGNELPVAAAGLGADTNLETALYKAYIETSAMPYAAIVNFAKADKQGDVTDIESRRIDNLEDNVYLYAIPQNRHVIEEKYTRDQRIHAADLPPDTSTEPGEVVRAVSDKIIGQGCRLTALDMTSDDIADLGFYVFRFYSPDLLPFGLPSYPPMAHPGFDAFGGAAHRRPHPYA